MVTPGIANLIRENKTFRINSAIQTGAKYGMNLMDDALFNLWRDGKVTVEDVLSKSHAPTTWPNVSSTSVVVKAIRKFRFRKKKADTKRDREIGPARSVQA